MPSSLLQTRADSFRSALTTTLGRVKVSLSAHEASADDILASEGARLGSFADGRIDSSLIRSLTANGSGLGDYAAPVQQAVEILENLSARGDQLFTLKVVQGAHLRDSVAAALADIGRAFGAARAFELVRTGAWPEDYASMLDAFPFSQWSAAERAIAPPLHVQLHGSDLQAAGLADFLDGNLALVLEVSGDCAPAPLARLVTPNTWVGQARTADALLGMNAFEGPCLAALVPEGAALFVNNPSAEIRFVLASAPEAPDHGRLGGATTRQQLEDLAVLESLRNLEASTPVPELPAEEAKSADKLAALLLQKAGFSS